ncbi:ABC transporter ATP-binding protein [Mycoplasma sp. 246B]
MRNNFHTSFAKQVPKLTNKQKISTFKNILKLLWKDNKITLIISLFLIIIGSGGLLYNQVFIGKIIIDGFLHNFSANAQNYAKTFNYKWFYIVVALSAVWFFITVFAGFIWKRLLIKVSNHTLTKLRSNLYKHIQSLPIAFFDANSKGDLMARFTSDIDTLRDFLSNSLPKVIDTFITLSVSVVVMFSLNWKLALIMLAVMLLILMFSYFIGMQSKKGFIKRQRSNGALSGFTEEVVSNLKTLKIFGQEQNVLNDYQKYSNSLYQDELKARGYADLLFPFAMWAGNLGYIIVAIFGAILLINGQSEGFGLSVGVLIAFTQFAKSFSSPVSSILEIANSIIIALAGGKRVFDILKQSPELNHGNIQAVKVVLKNNQYIESESDAAFWAYKFTDAYGYLTGYQKVQGEIVFDNVSFGYDQNIAIKNISFKAKAGSKIALVGPTGAGKTTITSLLIRFYEQNSGDIYIDGINIKEIDKNSLRKVIGMILQDASLFSDTVTNNITYGFDTIDHQQLHKSILVSNLTEHIDKLDAKEHTYLKDRGSKLSQGQKQLIRIARVTYKNPPILIFDEATSNIDTLTEYQIQTSMDKLLQNRTTFIIAHRLSTIKNADLILVINNGQIIEQGSHQQLLQNQGKYFQLWNNSQKQNI